MEVQLPRAVGPVQDGVGDYPLLSLDRFSIGLACCRLGSQTADYGRSGLKVPPLDLRDAERLDAVMAEVRPRIVLNASSGLADWATTAEGPIRLAMVAARYGTRLIHVSSDAVFSGAGVHYDESSLPDPITPYGAAKATAETGVLAVHSRATVARTSLIIGHGRSVHEKIVHELAAGTRDGTLFSDDIRCPVHVSELAAALLELAASDAAGIHHLAGSDAVSRQSSASSSHSGMGSTPPSCPRDCGPTALFPARSAYAWTAGRPSEPCGPHCAVLDSSAARVTPVCASSRHTDM